MLELKNIKKIYKTGTFTQNALNDISISFNKNEFISILGPSGSGKTTLLNIIGGLDRYTSGDLIINDKSTKKFKDKEWDSYRNNCIGFIFQNYNLISHISILSNVEMSLTLSGISAQKRRKKAKELLESVGLIEHANKKPSQLSGGQMQRVAIARALANDPSIILADEPTGALDTKTSEQILDLIKEISKDKLVIMVTHNEDLAENYSDRIIKLKDGKVVSDTSKGKLSNEKEEEIYKIKKTSMSFLTALKLSFNNIVTKKGRTILTALASSIGIIGIALILSLSNGFDIQIDKFERDTLSTLPITISKQSMNINEETLNSMEEVKPMYPSEEKIYSYSFENAMIIHNNNITNDYVSYVESIDSKLISGISYSSTIALNVLVKNENSIQKLTNSMFFSSLPKVLEENKNSYLEKNYDLLKGKFPENSNELVIIIDSSNQLQKELLSSLGITEEEVNFDELIGKELKLLLNDEYYEQVGNYFIEKKSIEEMYNNATETLKIVGIIRGNKDNYIEKSSVGGKICYLASLMEYVEEKNTNSRVVNIQKDASYNVLTGEMFKTEEDKINILSYLGYQTSPYIISIYPNDFSDKEKITQYLDEYNKEKDDENKIIYTDLASAVSTLSGSIMDGITVVLVAFSSISLIVSSIMIGIITYISVLERTKEIGILRSLGARKKDITRVFNAETFIIGITSGLLGIIIARILIIPANAVLYNLTELENVARLNYKDAIILVIVSTVLTLIGGFIPAKKASKRDPVEALRTE